MKENLKKRFLDPALVDEFLKVDEKWRKLKFLVDGLRKKRNEITKQIASGRKELVEEARKVKEELERAEEELKATEELRIKLLLSFPNLLDPRVPIGRDDSENVPVRYWGNPKITEAMLKGWNYPVDPEVVEFKLKDHIDLLFPKYAETEKAAKVAGARFYYMFDELVELERALIAFGLEFLKKQGFTLVEPPFMLKEDIMHKVLDYEGFKDMIYRIEGEDLVLIGTAEHPLAALHLGETLEEEELPKLYAGISPCFRKEAGSHGRDTKGIFRVHQFNKIEQFVFSMPEESNEWLDRIVRNIEEVFQRLEIPYRIVAICSGDLGPVAAIKYDLEAWLPGQGKYREMGSMSNCTEWQSRRLGIKYQRSNGERGFVHTLNGTLIALQRAIIAIVENHQQEDGSIKIPKVLWKYLDFKEIAPVEEKA